MEIVITTRENAKKTFIPAYLHGHNHTVQSYPSIGYLPHRFPFIVPKPYNEDKPFFLEVILYFADGEVFRFEDFGINGVYEFKTKEKAIEVGKDFCNSRIFDHYVATAQILVYHRGKDIVELEKQKDGSYVQKVTGNNDNKTKTEED